MLFEKLANKSQKDLILKTWESLRATHEILSEQTSFDELIKGLSESIKKGEISETKLEDRWLSHIATEQMNPSYPFLYACILNELAQQAFDRGELNQSWPLIAQASASAEGAAIHAFYNSQIDIPAALKRKKTTAGGNARGENFQLAKDYALTLMREKRPKLGWLDLKHAAQSIESELGAFIERERISLSSALLVNTLKRWHKTDERFRNLVNEIIDQ